MTSLQKLQRELRSHASPAKAKILQGFFKTGAGQYGEGDSFMGVTVPQSRTIAKKYKDSEFADLRKLLKSKIHEERLVALLILVQRYEKALPREQRSICEFYLRSLKYINNWDLVDLSAPKIVGKYLFYKRRDVLVSMARSSNIWERRIAIVSTFYFIQRGQFVDTLKISALLLGDGHDLIHKAVGWMLREVGKRSHETLERFLTDHYKKMPRTMLRYAIERYPERKRKQYLAGSI